MEDKCEGRALPTLMAQHSLWLKKHQSNCQMSSWIIWWFDCALTPSLFTSIHCLCGQLGIVMVDQLPWKCLLRWLSKNGLAQTNYAWRDQGRRSVRHIISAQLDSVEACYLYLNRPYLFCSKIPITWKRRVLASEDDYWIIILAVIE